MSLKRFLLVRVGRLVTWPVRRQLRRFEEQCEHPQAVQAAVRDRILRKQQGTGFGRDHKFAEIRTAEDFRRNVPVAPYEYVAPYIEKVQAGDTNALLADARVLMFALTSGTTASRKLIPVTQDYLKAYKRGWNMWGVRMYRDHRGRRIAMRPIVQMVGDPDEFRTSANIPCGNLTGFTAKVQMKLIRRLYGEKSQHFESYSSALSTNNFYYLHSEWNAHFSQVVGVARAIKHDLDNGLLVQFKALVQADVFADFLEMGEYLLQEGYKDAAAVIIGSVLEDGLRKLAEANGIPLMQTSGKPMTIDPLNVELAKQDVYSKLVQKQITSWAHIRNKAAHGEFGEYNKEQVQMMLLFVQGFAAEHFG